MSGIYDLKTINHPSPFITLIKKFQYYEHINQKCRSFGGIQSNHIALDWLNNYDYLILMIQSTDDGGGYHLMDGQDYVLDHL